MDGFLNLLPIDNAKYSMLSSEYGLDGYKIVDRMHGNLALVKDGRIIKSLVSESKDGIIKELNAINQSLLPPTPPVTPSYTLPPTPPLPPSYTLPPTPPLPPSYTPSYSTNPSQRRLDSECFKNCLAQIKYTGKTVSNCMDECIEQSPITGGKRRTRRYKKSKKSRKNRRKSYRRRR
jgi:hypothetical protein